MKKLILITLTCLAFLVFGSTAQAASSCKGKTQSACSSASSCSWVKSYKRKDGVKVKAHCRSAKKASTKKVTSKKKSSDKKKASKSKKTTKKKDSKKKKATKKKDKK